MQVAPPLQSLVFIPKADKGDYADNYRPLGLPNTCDRLLDRAAYSQFAPTLIGYLHPAQALLNTFREPQANFLTVQQYSLIRQLHLVVSSYLTLPKPLKELIPTESCTSSFHWEPPIGLSFTVGTSFSVGKFFTKLALTVVPLFTYALGLTWAELSRSYFFVSQWTPGITMCTKYLVYALTPDIWTTMPQEDMASAGFTKPSSLYISSTLPDSRSSPTPVTSPNHYLPAPTTLLLWKLTRQSLMATLLCGWPMQLCPPALMSNCAAAAHP